MNNPTGPHSDVAGENPFEQRLAYYDDASAPVRAMLALDAGRMGSWSWDITANTVVGDPFVAHLLNLDPDAQPWPLDAVFGSMHADDLPRVQAAVATALDGADIYEVEFRDRVTNTVTGAEGLRWLGARGRVTERASDGTPLRMIGVNWDATAQKEQEQRLAMLAAEMDHRVKNAFAVIRAMINIGRTAANDKESFAETLKAQVEAMATAHSVSAKIARSSETANAPVMLRQIIESALDPWLDIQYGDFSRVNLACESNIELTPVRVSAISMLVYELVTNAAKYGALSVPEGHLDITVAAMGSDRLQIVWAEHAPSSGADGPSNFEGFGTMLIDHCVQTLGATMVRTITDGNLKITIEMPYTQA